MHLDLYTAAQAAGIASLYEVPIVRVFKSVFNPFSGNLTTTTHLASLLVTGIAFQEASKQLQVTPLANITTNLWVLRSRGARTNALQTPLRSPSPALLFMRDNAQETFMYEPTSAWTGSGGKTPKVVL